MATSLLDIEKDVLNRLNEDFNSVLAELYSGSGGASTIPGIRRDMTVTGATNATPIVVTVSAAHNLSDGDPVSVSGVVTNTNANGSFFAKVTGQSATTFALYSDPALATAIAGNGAYGSGSPIAAGPSTMKRLVNEEMQALVRCCFPIVDTGTYAWLAGERTHRLKDFTAATTGQVLWAARALLFGATALTWCDASGLERSNPTWFATANGTPTRWYQEGESVGIYAPPSATSTTVTVSGLAEPKPVAFDGDTFAWLPDSLVHITTEAVAVKLAIKNMDDSAIYPRAVDIARFVDRERFDLWSKLDPGLRRGHYPGPPTGLLSKPIQAQ